MKKTIIFSSLMFFLAAVFPSCAQRPVGYQKIDPVLQALLKAPNDMAKKTILYPCIVYTKDTAFLQKMDIHPNTVLATFFTARLNKSQILRLAKTKQVTYIASPKPDQPQSGSR